MTDANIIGLASIGLILVLIYSGMYVSFALAGVSFLCVWLIRGDFGVASQMLTLVVNDAISDYVFGVIPLFVLMGFFVSISNIGRDTFEVANQFLRKIKGSLGVTTVAANAIFAAITGISIASAAVFTKIAVPEMLRFGYTPRFAVGVVAGSSVLGLLLPPSLLLILYGILTEQSIGYLFIAAIIPGIILAIAYIAGVILVAKFFPKLVYVDGKPQDEDQSVRRLQRSEILAKLSPIVLLIVLVIGGIYGGVFTPLEAGAVGALGAMIIAAFRRRLDAKSLWTVLVETANITASICFLIISATLYSRMLAISGISELLRSIFVDSGLGFAGLMAIILVMVILLGTLLDSSSIMLIVVPLLVPVLNGFGADLIWFGIVMLIAVEIGLLTPPFGISVFVVKSSLGQGSSISLRDIFVGVFPFVCVMFLVLLLVVLFPGLTTVLIR